MPPNLVDQGPAKTRGRCAGTPNKATMSSREKLKARLALVLASVIMRTGCRTIASPAWGWTKAC